MPGYEGVGVNQLLGKFEPVGESVMDRVAESVPVTVLTNEAFVSLGNVNALVLDQSANS